MKFFKNNKGSALMTVVCIMALLSIIGSMLLVKTTNNRDLKEQEKKAQDAFYKADSSSMEFASALDSIAQDAIKKAFSDLMISYTKYPDTAARGARFGLVFTDYLKNKLTEGTTAEEILKNALGVTALDVTVNFDSSKVTTDASVMAGKMTDKIILHDVLFSYKDADGHVTKVTTDINIDAKIPNIERGMLAGTCAEFYDFALITGGKLYNKQKSTNTQKITGNVFVEKDLSLGFGSSKISFEKCDKFLVKGNIDLKGSVDVTFNNSDITSANGKGIWAKNIQLDASKLTGTKTSFYVSDDLVLSGKNTVFTSNGEEYVGYSGGSADETSEKSSAITINYAKDITLDLSAMNSLILRGSSYIQDKVWAKGSSDASNLLGILQGESVAYKDMQAMYLVPSECSPFGQNPVLLDMYNEHGAFTQDELDNILNFDLNEIYESSHHYLSAYLDADKPFVTRYVILDGGSTEFVYLYLNFQNATAANQFYVDYLSTKRGLKIKEQIMNLNDTGKSKIALAKNNYTLANMFEFNKNDDNVITTIGSDASNFSVMSNKSRTTAQQYTGLFSFFRLDYNTTIPDGYDVISEAVLSDTITNNLTALGETSLDRKVTCKGGDCWFVVRSGNTKTSNLSTYNGKKGIILIDGDVEFDNGFKFEGLILSRGNADINNMEIQANKDVVIEMLDDEIVAQFFCGQGAKGSKSDGTYISSDSVTIEFENWQKN